MSIICAGDMHFPFVNHGAIRKLIAHVAKERPEYVVQIGDLYDNYAFSKYTKVVNHMTPQQELNRGRGLAEKFWSDVQRASPKSKCIQMMGNHCARIIKRVLEVLPALDARVKMRDKVEKLHNIDGLFRFSGVTTYLDWRANIKLDGVLFTHGFRGNIGEHAKYFNCNTVTGHLHRGGVVYQRVNNRTIWEINCGFMGNVSALPFQYGDNAVKQWTVGYGVVDKDGPRFIHL